MLLVMFHCFSYTHRFSLLGKYTPTLKPLCCKSAGNSKLSPMMGGLLVMSVLADCTFFFLSKLKKYLQTLWVTYFNCCHCFWLVKSNTKAWYFFACEFVDTRFAIPHARHLQPVAHFLITTGTSQQKTTPKFNPIFTPQVLWCYLSLRELF